MRKFILFAAFAGLAALATAATGATKAIPSGHASLATALVSCNSATIGGMFPLTVVAPGVGDEQRNWAVMGLADTNKALHTHYKMVQADTQLTAGPAATVAQQFASNSNMVAVIGPAGSQEVIASGPIYKSARMPFVSSSATRAGSDSLTDGRFPTFSRDVPNDDIQGPSMANFVYKNLKGRRVVVIDDQTSYGAPLADTIESKLKSKSGSSVSRKSVPRSQTDFSALVTSIPSNTQVVVLAWQSAANGQQFARQMKEQGKNAKVFGSDGLFDPSAFTAEGAYVSVFAPTLPANSPYSKAYTKRFHKEFGAFGPPAYVVAQIEATAIKSTCKKGSTTRSAVAKAIRKTKLKKTPLGAWKGFDSHGDPKGAHFYIYKIVNGKYKLANG
jgi:branched-chain amino acid transport system substrate-binding protein